MWRKWGTLSTYAEELSIEDRETYAKKLTLNNETLLPDPLNINDNKWSSDITFLPDLSWPDIVNYVINTPSEFTKDKIKAYKSLEAYNFFVNGHVQDVFIHKLEKFQFSFLKTKVLPSQRQGQKQVLYESWVAMHRTGWILCANCSCTSG